MKATGIVRRIDDWVIIGTRVRSLENTGVSLILSNFTGEKEARCKTVEQRPCSTCKRVEQGRCYRETDWSSGFILTIFPGPQKPMQPFSHLLARPYFSRSQNSGCKDHGIDHQKNTAKTTLCHGIDIKIPQRGQAAQHGRIKIVSSNI